MAEADLQELNEQFATGNKQLEPDVVAELQSIMRMHSLSVQDLFFKWESYCIKMEMDEIKLSVETLRALKQDIQDELERSNRSHHVHIKSEKRSGATPRTAVKSGGDVFGMLDGLVPSTPGGAKLNKSAAKKRNHLETPSVSRTKGNVLGSSPDFKSLRIDNQLESMNAIPASSFNDRANAGEAIEVLNEHLKSGEPPVVPYAEPRIKLTAASDQKKLNYKTLAMKLSEASEILDDRIDEFAALVRERHGLDEDALGSAAAQSTTEVVAVGRIASDSPEGKLNAASVVLETSRRTGGGRRVPLNLQRLTATTGKFAVFPGQIVAFRGINTSGSEFVAHEVLEIPLLPSAASAPSAIEAHRQRLRGGAGGADPDAMDTDDAEPAPLNVLFAAGPYTADDNLDFEPLHALCSAASSTYADAVVLAGPFIDVDHPLIATGDFDLPEEALHSSGSADPDTATLATLFKHLISPALGRLAAANPAVTIVLVPSVRDAVARHVSWPQDALPRRDLGLPRAARLVGNPMTLSLNETLVGLSSHDALWDLRQEELLVGSGAAAGAGAPPENLFSRLARHIVEQRHFAPVFPPTDRTRLPKTGTEEGIPVGASLDTSFLKLGEMVNVRPDVVVVPSALPPFARVVESVVVINPGPLSKRRGAGTYARMTLHAPRAADAGDAAVVGHRVFERARVEITRI